ncbi:CDI system lipoprotein BcpO [Paraburkholderia phenazinium]|uniref:CDI system lipoprotein BcpO n=1 Tax=Paraburkholderia phenazinium TaxID=60549 RepID=UPI0009415CAE|nr:CDI system lipoprotein BcpO [Paraburkholderia phenazinium]
MTRIFFALIALALLTACQSAPPGAPPKPPPIPEMSPMLPNSAWVGGYWHWDGAQWVWIRGHVEPKL